MATTQIFLSSISFTYKKKPHSFYIFYIKKSFDPYRVPLVTTISDETFDFLMIVI